jgi:hypothetical protein
MSADNLRVVPGNAIQWMADGDMLVGFKTRSGVEYALPVIQRSLPSSPARAIPLPIAVGTNLTINADNAPTYDGATLEITTALSITLSAGLPLGFSIIVMPPAGGNVSIVSAGGVLLNGSTTTITRAAAQNAAFAALPRATVANSYVVTGE